MFEKLEIIRMAQAYAAHQGARMGVIARNVANADTPGFKAQDLADFAAVYDDPGLGLRVTRRGHIAADPPMPGRPHAVATPGAAAPNGNTVSLEAEMVKAVETRQGHDMALAVYRATADVLRASLGRR